jgi:DHA1 family tetracycline resistance protein-like MFS transporter
MVVQAGLIGRAVKTLGERGSLVVGMAFGALAFFFYGIAPVGSLFVVGIPFGALWGIADPALQALMTRRVSGRRQGQLQGGISSLRGIAGMIGPLVFTQAFAAAIRPGSLLPLPGAPFLLSAALLVLCAAAAAPAARGA